ncbi:MAG: hypothetical protein ACK2T0_02350 [Anaerolineales bacterium]|jgi:hypothetical protein
MSPRGRSQQSFPFSLLSLLAAPLSWAALFASGRASAGIFSEGASNTMFTLLWIGAAVAAAGVVLGIAAVRTGAAKRLLGIVALVLNLITLAVFVFLGLFWAVLSI